MSKSDARIDYQIFLPTLIVLLVICIPIAINPEAVGKVVNTALEFLTGKFGWLFEFFVLGTFLFLLWLAFGRYGRVKLGRPDDKPEFSYFTWIAMLFCSGIGTSLLYWSIIEPIYYLQGPPIGIQPGIAAESPAAAEWAAAYGLFHWGFSAWAIYAIPTIPIAYALYVKKIPVLRMSTACQGVIGKHAHGFWGKAIDIAAMFGIVGGSGTALGIGVTLISAEITALFGIPDSFGLKIAIIIIWTCLFGGSVFLGLYKGIANLSNFNVMLCLGFTGYVFLFGPTEYILNLFANSTGLVLDNFFRLSLWTDPVAKGGFPQAWTTFYWAWWIALAPLMGLFVARISKGRTIRELVIAECFWGTLGCWLYFVVFGGYTLYLEMNNILPVSAMASEEGATTAIVAVIQSLPMPKFVLAITLIISFVFSGTTFDSSAYALASGTSTGYSVSEGQPTRWLRGLWALIIGIIAVLLLLVGGLTVLQISSVLVALPLIPVFIIMTMSILKWVKEDHDKDVK
ncbi:MAG: BCCT family transporter [Dehalobacterium sp.]